MFYFKGNSVYPCPFVQILRMNNQGLGHQGARYLAEALSKGIKESNNQGLRLVHFSAGRNRLENYGACLLADVFAKMGSLEEVYLVELHKTFFHSFLFIKME